RVEARALDDGNEVVRPGHRVERDEGRCAALELAERLLDGLRLPRSGLDQHVCLHGRPPAKALGMRSQDRIMGGHSVPHGERREGGEDRTRWDVSRAKDPKTAGAAPRHDRTARYGRSMSFRAEEAPKRRGEPPGALDRLAGGKVHARAAVVGVVLRIEPGADPGDDPADLEGQPLADVLVAEAADDEVEPLVIRRREVREAGLVPDQLDRLGADWMAQAVGDVPED